MHAESAYDVGLKKTLLGGTRIKRKSAYYAHGIIGSRFVSGTSNCLEWPSSFGVMSLFGLKDLQVCTAVRMRRWWAPQDSNL